MLFPWDHMGVSVQNAQESLTKTHYSEYRRMDSFKQVFPIQYF